MEERRNYRVNPRFFLAHLATLKLFEFLYYIILWKHVSLQSYIIKHDARLTLYHNNAAFSFCYAFIYCMNFCKLENKIFCIFINYILLFQ